MPNAADMLAHLTANVARVQAGEAPKPAAWQASSPNEGLKDAPTEGYVADPQAPVVVDETPAAAPAAEPEGEPVRDTKGRFVPKLVEQPVAAEAETAEEAVARIEKMIVDGEEVTDADVRELKQFRLTALRGETQAQVAKREADAKMADVMAKFADFDRKNADLSAREEHVDELWRTARERPDLFMQLAQADGPAPAADRKTTNAPPQGKFLTPEDLNKVLDDREKSKADAAAVEAKGKAFEVSVNKQLDTLSKGDPVLRELMFARVAAWNGAGFLTSDHSPAFIAEAVKDAHKQALALTAKSTLATQKAAPKQLSKAPPATPTAGGTPIAGKEAPTSDPRELKRRIDRALSLAQTQRPAPARI